MTTEKQREQARLRKQKQRDNSVTEKRDMSQNNVTCDEERDANMSRRKLVQLKGATSSNHMVLKGTDEEIIEAMIKYLNDRHYRVVKESEARTGGRYGFKAEFPEYAGKK